MQMRAASQDFLNYSYDSLKRLTGINIIQDSADQTNVFKIAQSYVSLGNNRTTTQIQYYNYRTPGGTLIAGNKYEYDNAGNISKIYDSSSLSMPIAEYTYDTLNQLTQEIRRSGGNTVNTGDGSLC